MIVDPSETLGVEEALLGFALTRSLFDFVMIEASPGGPVQLAAEGLGFRAIAVVPELLIGPDGSPSRTRSC